MALLADAESEDEDIDLKKEKLDLTPFLRIHAEILGLFHAHWRKEEFTVMRKSLPVSLGGDRDRDERSLTNEHWR